MPADLQPPIARPRRRCECADGPRPCVFIGCTHNLLRNDRARTRTSSRAFAETLELQGGYAVLPGDRHADDAALEAFATALVELAVDVEHTCTLDVAEHEGEHTPEEIAELLAVTVGQVRRDLRGALLKLLNNERMRALR